MEKNNIRRLFRDFFGAEPAAAARAPGRLEILGNHTDYNEGFVLSAAVGQAASFAMAPAEGKKCRIKVFDSGLESVFSLDDIDKAVPGDWANYIKGVPARLAARGIKTGAFNAGLVSDVPVSAGMSSSAALEISACLAFGKVFGIDMPKAEWARVGQEVENKYIGVKTGLLDQFSSIFGKKDSLILCDFRTVEVLRTVPVPAGYAIVVANTMVKHNLVDSDYNRRRESCERAAHYLASKNPGLKTLRDADEKMLEAARGGLDKIDFMRAMHIAGEDRRVLDGAKLLERGEIEAFGKLLFESHKSSREYFENSCPELDCLVGIASTLPDCIGARLSGGGFGGISIHLVKEGGAEKYCERLKTAYSLRTDKKAETLVCSIGDGAALME
jgi:galactokinase